MKFIFKMKLEIVLFIMTMKVGKEKIRKFINNHLKMDNLNHVYDILVIDTKNKQLSKPIMYFKIVSSMQNTKNGNDTENDRG